MPMEPGNSNRFKNFSNKLQFRRYLVQFAADIDVSKICGRSRSTVVWLHIQERTDFCCCSKLLCQVNNNTIEMTYHYTLMSLIKFTQVVKADYLILVTEGLQIAETILKLTAS